MLKSGLNLNRSLLIMNKQGRSEEEKEIYQKILQSIESGLTFSESLAEEKEFDRLFNSVVAAGERSGTLTEVLKRLETYYKNKKDLKKEIKKASFYPLTVVTAVFLAAGFIFKFILPVFIDLFNDFEGELPLISRIFIQISTIVNNHFLLLIILFLILTAFLIFLFKEQRFSSYKSSLMLKIPFFKTLYQDLILTQLAVYLSLFLKSGLNLISALEFIADIIENSKYKQFINNTVLNISKGASLAECFSDRSLIPDLFYYLLITGEESAQMEIMLERAGDYYYQKLKEEIAKMLQYLEPLLISLTAIFVALLAAAVIMPMFQLYLII